MKRDWRPGLIVSNNYIAVLYLSMFTDKVQVLEFPGAFGGLLAFGLPLLLLVDFFSILVHIASDRKNEEGKKE